MFEAYQARPRWYLLVRAELDLAQGDGDRVGIERYWTAEGTSRVHGTGGFDVRLFEWDMFGLLKPFDF